MMLGLGAAQYAQRFKEDSTRTRNTSATKSSNWSVRCGTKTHLLKRARRPVLLADILAAPKGNRPATMPAGGREEFFAASCDPGLERQFKPELHQSWVVHRPRYSPEVERIS